jgi:outer membrane protein assembly factor BamB
MTFLIASSYVAFTESPVQASSSTDNWPMFHNDLTHTGYSTSKPAAASATLLWNYTTNSVVWASPAIVDGRVYIGSDGGIAYCLNASDGSEIWNYTIQAATRARQGAGGPAIGSSMAVTDGYVYFGCYDRNVYCLDASTGAKIWNYTTQGWVDSSPAVANSYIYVGCWSTNAKNYATLAPPSNVYCLDASTGAKIWNYTTQGGVDSSPAVVGGYVYVGGWDGNVYCLDALTGNKIWNYTAQAHVNSSPAVAGGIVYVGSWDHKVYAFGTPSNTTAPSLPVETIYLLAAIIAAVLIVAAMIALKRRKH